MDTWEYGQIFVVNPQPYGGLPKEALDITKLKRAGQEGWELVSVIPYTTPDGGVSGAFMILKRPGGRADKA